MKHRIALPLFLGILLSCTAGAEPLSSESWSQTVESGNARYSILYDHDASRFEVVNLKEGVATPGMMKISIHRKHAAPLVLKLKSVEAPNQPIRYLGDFRQWDASVTGVQLEMSFDKKTWRNVGRFFHVSPR